MPADWISPLIGFISGIGVSTIAAVVSSLLQKRTERLKRREHAAFEVYMLLLDLNAQYFWIVSNDLHGEARSSENVAELERLSFRIADKLRETDDIPYLEDILLALMSEDAFKTASDRANALDDIIGKLGNEVNPRYTKIIHHISEENIRGVMSRPADHRNNAPAMLRR